MTIALLNCPFCGLRKTKIQEAGVKEWAVYCKNDRCQAYGPVGLTKGEARRKWNTRSKNDH